MAQKTLTKIEQLRADMVQEATKHDFNFTHPDVVAISQQIDLLMNQYMRLIHCSKE